MSKSTAALVIRQAALESQLSSRDPLINTQMGGWKQLLAFIQKYEKAMRWHPKYHAPMLMQMMTCLNSIERKSSMASSRAEGRLATMLDFTKSTGCGFGRCMPAIEAFNDIEPADRKFNERLGCVFPVHTLLPRSNRIFEFMDNRLAKRDLMRGDRTLTKAERECLMLDSTMSNDSIVRYTIEYMARSFAVAISKSARYELIRGDQQLGIKAVLDDLNFLPAV